MDAAKKFRRAMMIADDRFDKAGVTGTREYIIGYLTPAMNDERVTVIGIDELAALRGEVDKLRESVAMCIDERNGLWEEVVRLKTALARYREAVEWACNVRISRNIHGREIVDNGKPFDVELRRRAGRE